MTAKQAGRIIETLEPRRLAAPKPATPSKPSRDWGPMVGEIVQAAEQLKGGQDPMHGPAFSLLKASARLAQAAVQAPDDLDALRKQESNVRRALTRLQTTLERADI